MLLYLILNQFTLQWGKRDVKNKLIKKGYFEYFTYYFLSIFFSQNFIPRFLTQKVKNLTLAIKKYKLKIGYLHKLRKRQTAKR